MCVRVCAVRDVDLLRGFPSLLLFCVIGWAGLGWAGLGII